MPPDDDACAHTFAIRMMMHRPHTLGYSNRDAHWDGRLHARSGVWMYHVGVFVKTCVRLAGMRLTIHAGSAKRRETTVFLRVGRAQIYVGTENRMSGDVKVCIRYEWSNNREFIICV